MAGFTFETMTAGDAAAFKPTDSLFFQAADPNSITASYTASVGTTVATITLTADGRSLTFPAASLEGNTHLSFIADGSTLNLTSTAATAVLDTDSVVFGFDTAKAPVGFTFTVAAGDGDHAIHAGFGADTVDGATADGNNYVWGGLGDDTITLGAGNNHVYGGDNVAGAKDGADTITVTDGSNYINGNAGNDVIEVGSGASTGVNRVQGGADDDTITIHGGVGASSSINGNKGDDGIDASDSLGNNAIHGGQGNDTILTGHGHDTVSGDLGDDTIVVGGTALDHHLAILTGGDGSDTFDFSGVASGTAFDIKAGVAGTANYGANTYYQEVTDFTAADDLIALGARNPTAATDFAVLKTSFANVSDAQHAAAADTAHHVVATQVGGDTYLFFAGASEVVKLDHTTASDITFANFA